MQEKTDFIGAENLHDSSDALQSTDSRPLSPSAYFKIVGQQNPSIKLLNNHATDPLYHGCGVINRLNGQAILGPSTEAILFNEQTQEYTINDPVYGSRPIKIDSQNIVIKNGNSYYKIIREELIPIYNQSDLASFSFLNGLPVDQSDSGKENLSSTTPNLMEKSSLSRLLLANQDSLCGPNQFNEADVPIEDSGNPPGYTQAKRPKSDDGSVLPPFGDRTLPFFGSPDLNLLMAEKFVSLFSADNDVANDEAKISRSQPQSSSTPIKTEKAMSSQSSASKPKKKSKDKKESTIFDCPHCPKKCGNKGALVSHVKRHAQEKPFACRVCLARFSSKGSLTKHSRSHTGEIPFTCIVCKDKGFNDNDSLRAHMRTQHSDLKQFTCDQCGRRYAHPRSLKKHQKSHHKQPTANAEEEVDAEQDEEEQETSNLDSSEIRFISMLSDLEQSGSDFNVVFQQPDNH